MAPETQYEVGSVQRAVSLVEAVAETPGLRLAELARRLGANSSTVLRTLRVLEKAGFVRRDGSGGYLVGLRVIEIGLAGSTSIDIVSELRRVGEELSQRLGVTAHIGIFNSGAVTIIGKFDPVETLVRYSTLGTRMPLHATAAGKAARALAEAGGQSLVLDLPLEKLTPETVIDSEVLRRASVADRARGYSWEAGEYQLGFCCVGAAASVGTEIYTVSLSGAQVPPADQQAWGVALREAIELLATEYRGMVRTLGTPPAGPSNISIADRAG